MFFFYEFDFSEAGAVTDWSVIKQKPRAEQNDP